MFEGLATIRLLPRRGGEGRGEGGMEVMSRGTPRDWTLGIFENVPRARGDRVLTPDRVTGGGKS